MSLNIYFGPMYAGKTSKLMNMYRHTYENKIVIDYNTLDLSKNHNPMYVYYGNLKSHNENNIFIDKVLKTKSLNMLNDIDNYNIVENEKNDLYNKYINAKFIFINECQFFIDLKYYVLDQLKTHLLTENYVDKKQKEYDNRALKFIDDMKTNTSLISIIFISVAILILAFAKA